MAGQDKRTLREMKIGLTCVELGLFSQQVKIATLPKFDRAGERAALPERMREYNDGHG